jgi:hypothetical protein
VSLVALRDEERSTASTIRRPDPRRTDYTSIDFEPRSYEGEPLGQEHVVSVDPLNPDPVRTHGQLSSFVTCHAALFNSFVKHYPDRSGYFDVPTSAFQIASPGSQIKFAVNSAGAVSEVIGSIGTEVAESLLALAAARDSFSVGIDSWSNLTINAYKQIANALMTLNLPTTATSSAKLLDPPDDGTVLDPGVETALTDFLERIADFARLDPDWDSYGAKSPTTQAVTAAGKYLRTLVTAFSSKVGIRALPFWVYPVPSGGVKLEWREPKSELEVEIEPEGNLRYLLQTGHGPEADFEEREEVSVDEVTKILGRVLAA